tara:strand:- start:311 stop:1024 length:714 start_codon:yes stop_codon:yes gene_type:complete
MGHYEGIDVFDEQNLVGQAGGIPYNFKYKNKVLKTLVSINVCVDEAYRGRKIFQNLAKKLEILLKKKNYELLIAITNKSAAPGWFNSIQMRYLCQLDTFIGLKDFSKIDISIKDYNLHVDWSDTLIDWRCSNPYNKTNIEKYKDVGLVYSKTQIPFSKVYAPYPFKIDNKSLQQFKNKNDLKIFIGLSKEINSSFFFKKIPEFLKPSPLKFIYKFLNQKYDLKKEEVYFTFLDFDAF